MDKIINGRKRWEIRGSRTKIRGVIGLIKSRSSVGVGTAELVDCIGPLTASEYRENARKIGNSKSANQRPYGSKTFAWVLKNVKMLDRPVPYTHPSGAVIWVKLKPGVERRPSR